MKHLMHMSIFKDLHTIIKQKNVCIENYLLSRKILILRFCPDETPAPSVIKSEQYSHLVRNMELVPLVNLE